MAQNAVALSAKYFVVDLIGGIVLFPVWWYTRGLVKMGSGVLDFWTAERSSLAIGVWIKNIFTPMYGTHDIAGRLISFFMRIVQIIGRTIVLLIWTVLLLLFFVAYLVFPAFVALEVVYHLVGSLL